MSTFNPFDKNASAKDAARDRQLAESARKVQLETEARRKKQLISIDITRIQQVLNQRQQEFLTLKQDVEHSTHAVAEKKKELEALESELREVDRALLEENNKMKILSQAFEGAVLKLKSLHLKLNGFLGKDRKDTDSVAHQKSLLLTMTKRHDVIVTELEHINKTITEKERELERLSAERNDLNRKIEEQKGIISKAKLDLIHSEGLQKEDTKDVSESKLEEKRLIDESESKESEIESVKAQYQLNLNKKAIFSTKKNDVGNFISTTLNVLRQKELRLRNVESEIKKAEGQLREKERELQGIKI